MLQAVGAIACCALVCRHAGGVDEGLACAIEALLIVRVQRRFGIRWTGAGHGGGSLRPSAGFGAFVCMLGAVVKAVRSALFSTSSTSRTESGLWRTLYSSDTGMEGNLVHGSTPFGSAPQYSRHRRRFFPCRLALSRPWSRCKAELSDIQLRRIESRTLSMIESNASGIC